MKNKLKYDNEFADQLDPEVIQYAKSIGFFKHRESLKNTDWTSLAIADMHYQHHIGNYVEKYAFVNLIGELPCGIKIYNGTDDVVEEPHMLFYRDGKDPQSIESKASGGGCISAIRPVYLKFSDHTDKLSDIELMEFNQFVQKHKLEIRHMCDVDEFEYLYSHKLDIPLYYNMSTVTPVLNKHLDPSELYNRVNRIIDSLRRIPHRIINNFR